MSYATFFSRIVNGTIMSRRLPSSHIWRRRCRIELLEDRHLLSATIVSGDMQLAAEAITAAEEISPASTLLAEATLNSDETVAAESLLTASELWMGDPIPSAAYMPYVEGVEHLTVHQAIEGEYQFLHGAGIINHKGVFYAAWANSPVNENSEDEVVRGRRSYDGGYTWTDIEVIAPDLLGPPSHSHGAFFSHHGDLWYFANRIVPGPDPARADAYKLNETTDQWEPIATVAIDFTPFDEPTLMSNGKWIVGGSMRALSGGSAPAVAFFDDDDVTHWTVVEIPVSEGTSLIFPETSVWVSDSEIVAITRNSNQNLALVSVSEDCGVTWTTASVSNFTMAASEPFAGTLSNGQRYLISNFDGSRDVLTIAVSRPNEESLVKIWKIRDGVSIPPLYPDDYGVKSPQWSYPHAFEYEDKLYVVYSIGKEDAGLSIFPISSLSTEEQGGEEDNVVASQVIAYERFDTYSGSIDQGAAGGGWTDEWSAASAHTTAQSTDVLAYGSGAVVVSGGIRSVQHTGDNNNPQVSRSIPSQAGVLYFSLLVQLSTLADDAFVGFHFTDSNGGLDNTPSLEAGVYGGAGDVGFVRAAVYNASNYRGVDSASYNSGDTVFIVGRISDEGFDPTAGNYDRLELFVNPTTLAEPAAATLAADYVTGLTSLDTFAVRTANFSTGESALFDELRIGTTYASVVRTDLVGDYNHNGSVDTADYTVWRDTLGQTVTPGSGADGNGDGEIGEIDYTVWQVNYGQTADPAFYGTAPAVVATASANIAVGAASPAAETEAPGNSLLLEQVNEQDVLTSVAASLLYGNSLPLAVASTGEQSGAIARAQDHAWESFADRDSLLLRRTDTLRHLRSAHDDTQRDEGHESSRPEYTDTVYDSLGNGSVGVEEFGLRTGKWRPLLQ